MTAKTNGFQEYNANPTVANRNKLVEDHLYMVEILIRKYLGKGVEYDDLYQVGALALVSAVERFDPDKGFEFSSFATPTILGEIKKYFRDKQWSLKVPRRLKEISAKVQDAKEKLSTELGKNPTIPEIAKFTGLSDEQIIEAMEGAKAYSTYSLDKTFDDMTGEGDSAFLEKYTGFDEKGYEQLETKEIIEKVLNKMTEQNKYIFRERFIFNKSQAEIGKILGVSQMTVSRAERSMVEQFRAELKKS